MEHPAGPESLSRAGDVLTCVRAKHYGDKTECEAGVPKIVDVAVAVQAVGATMVFA